MAAERLDAVLDPDEAGAVTEGRTAAPVVVHLDPQHLPPDVHLDVDFAAEACLAALVSASATT